jgi:hypothetical protein
MKNEVRERVKAQGIQVKKEEEELSEFESHSSFMTHSSVDGEETFDNDVIREQSETDSMASANNTVEQKYLNNFREMSPL